MADHNELGQKGEEMASNYLVDKGYKVLASNYRYRHLEIDIIAQKDDELVVVEVKTRQSSYLTDPSELLSKKKQKDLIKAANKYIEEYEIDLDCRFDLVIVISNSKGNHFEHIEGAFGP